MAGNSVKRQQLGNLAIKRGKVSTNDNLLGAGEMLNIQCSTPNEN
jgi:hypothetical protein